MVKVVDFLNEKKQNLIKFVNEKFSDNQKLIDSVNKLNDYDDEQFYNYVYLFLSPFKNKISDLELILNITYYIKCEDVKEEDRQKLIKYFEMFIDIMTEQ